MWDAIADMTYVIGVETEQVVKICPILWLRYCPKQIFADGSKRNVNWVINWLSEVVVV